MTKIRIFEGLSKKDDKSSELMEFKERFDALKIKLRKLIVALQNQRSAMVNLGKARREVAKTISELAHISPISDQAGEFMFDDDESQTEGDLSSYLSIHLALNSHHKDYVKEFSKNIVDYAVDWERIIVVRVNKSFKQAEKYRKDLYHYEIKCDSQQDRETRILSKKKTIDQSFEEKLKRNQEKLTQSRQNYESYMSSLKLLLEEIVDRCWKDLHPILLKLAQFDFLLASDENTLLSQLKLVADSLINVAMRHGLKPNARLKELQVKEGKHVSTKEFEDELSGKESMLTLMGPAPECPSTNSFSDVKYPHPQQNKNSFLFPLIEDGDVTTCSSSFENLPKTSELITCDSANDSFHSAKINLQTESTKTQSENVTNVKVNSEDNQKNVTTNPLWSDCANKNVTDSTKGQNKYEKNGNANSDDNQKNITTKLFVSNLDIESAIDSSKGHNKYEENRNADSDDNRTNIGTNPFGSDCDNKSVNTNPFDE